MGGSGSSSGIGAPRRFSSDSDMVEFGIESYSRWKDGLTSKELSALNDYVSDSSAINDYLRDGTGPAALANQVKSIDSALNKASLPENLTVYRGVGDGYLGMDFSSESSVRAMVGKTFTDKGYMSTSLSREVSEIYGGNRRGGAVLKINAKKGSHGAYTDFVESSARQLREYAADGDTGNIEYTFKRGSSIKITGFNRRRSSSGREILRD